MGDTKVRGETAFIGVGEFIPSPQQLEPRYIHMLVEPTRRALEDAGLTKNDIDGIVYLHSSAPPEYPVTATVVAQYLGIKPAFAWTIQYGGMPPSSAVTQAALAIGAGLAHTVLIVCGDNRTARLGRNNVVKILADAAELQWERPYGPLVISFFALMAQRHMHVYGTTPEQLAAVAVAARRHASLNPLAVHRTPITIADVLNSRMITSPLHLLDICFPTDGGVALVLTSADRARDAKRPPVYVLGVGECGEYQHVVYSPDLLSYNSVRIAADHAFRMAGVDRSDIDLVELHDAVTIVPIILLEELGFFPKGENFVEKGMIEPGGKLPVNTHGGLLSYGHPGMPGPMFGVAEAVKQLRKDCGERQVKGAELALVETTGGCLANICVTILGRNRR